MSDHSAPASVLPIPVLATLGVVAASIGFGLVPFFARSLTEAGMARTAMAGSIELPTMFVVGWLAFGESVGPAQWAACALIVTAIVLTPSKVTRNVATNIAT